MMFKLVKLMFEVGEMSSLFVQNLLVSETIDNEENFSETLQSKYEGIVISNLINAFGINKILMIQEGGNVDAISNIRKGISPKSKKQRKNFKF